MTLASQHAAYAFPLSNGDQVQCEFSHGDKTGVATEIWNSYRKPEDRNPELGRAVAVMRLDASGWPTIIIDAEAHKRNAKGAPAIWDFVYFHECAHAQNPSITEIGANCAAYLEMGRRGLMNYHRSKQLETMHFNMMSILPMEFAGSGAQFWHQTLQCVRKTQQESLR
jgi:hypothetical protein